MSSRSHNFVWLHFSNFHLVNEMKPTAQAFVWHQWNIQSSQGQKAMVLRKFKKCLIFMILDNVR